MLQTDKPLSPYLNLIRIAVGTVEDTEYPTRYHKRLLNRYFRTAETFIMPSKAAKSGTKRGGFTTTFVNYKLSNSDKAEFVKFMNSGEEKTQHAFVEAMGKGNKFSVSMNDEKGFYLVAMTCRDEGSINYDYCITSRSPDWWEAVIMCVFKAQQLGYDQSWADMSDSDDWG